MGAVCFLSSFLFIPSLSLWQVVCKSMCVYHAKNCTGAQAIGGGGTLS